MGTIIRPSLPRRSVDRDTRFAEWESRNMPTSRWLGLCDEFTWFGLARMGSAIRFMHRNGVRRGDDGRQNSQSSAFSAGGVAEVLARLANGSDVLASFYRETKRPPRRHAVAGGGRRLGSSGNPLGAGHRLRTGAAREIRTTDPPRPLGRPAARHSIRLAIGQGAWPARRRARASR